MQKGNYKFNIIQYKQKKINKGKCHDSRTTKKFGLIKRQQHITLNWKTLRNAVRRYNKL